MAPPVARKIAVTGGGSAGHILPAIEFLQTYRRECGATGYFIGCSAGMEGRLVPASGERLQTIPGFPWARQNWIGRVRSLASIPPAVLAARRILHRERTELVIGAGGYAAFGACLAAYTLGIPVVIHEPNAAPGLANRLAARIATLVCSGFAEARFHANTAVEVTGVPTGGIEFPAWRGTAPWQFLVLGGSEGSPILNREAPRLFAELRRRGGDFRVRHLTGLADAAGVARAYADADVAAEVKQFVEDRAVIYRDATLAIASAGAHTMAELSAAGIPALLVPLPGAANDHQTANANLYAARTGARIVPQSEWNAAEQAGWLAQMLADPARLHRLHEGTLRWQNRNAAQNVVQACERLLEARQATARSAQA